MKNRIVLTLLIVQLSACAFKESPSSKGESQTQKQNKMAFIPKDLRFTDGVQIFAVIDSMTLQPGDYQINQTVSLKGLVEYPYQYPSFQPTDCTGLGYTVSYDPKRRGASATLKLKIFLNGSPLLLDHVVASPIDKIQVAVYVDYAPISDFIDKGTLPNEFIKTFQPSSKCHMACRAVRIKPPRPLRTIAQGCMIHFFGHGNEYGNNEQTEDLAFQPFGVEASSDAITGNLGLLTGCLPDLNNQDLEYFYAQDTNGECAYNWGKSFIREWFFVEQKVPYSPPVYTINNLSEVIKNTSETQTEYLKDMPVHPNSDWSN